MNGLGSEQRGVAATSFFGTINHPLEIEDTETLVFMEAKIALSPFRRGWLIPLKVYELFDGCVPSMSAAIRKFRAMLQNGWPRAAPNLAC